MFIYIINKDPRGKVNALNSPLQPALWYFCPYLFILDISKYFLTTNSILPFCGLFLSQSIHYGYFLLQTLVRSFREGGEWVVTTKSFIVASILDYFFSLHGTKCVEDIIWIYYKSIFFSLSRQKYSKTDLHGRLSVNLWCIWFFSNVLLLNHLFLLFKSKYSLY